jgi:hypothetical protein
MNKHFLFSQWLMVLTIILGMSGSTFCQTADADKTEKKLAQPPQFALGTDLVSRYVWRGRDYGNSPAIQPNASFSVAGFKIGVWGSYGFVPYSQMINDSTIVNMGNYAEFDPFISYTLKGFTLTLTDYFTFNGLTPNAGNYFNYKNSTTGHTLEVSLAWNGPEKFPLQLYVGTLVYGADKGKDDYGNYGLGTENNYSTYIEASYPFEIKGFGLKPIVGFIPFGSSWYGPTAGVPNVGLTLSKTIPITKDFGLPLFTSIFANPQSKSIFFVFGLTI